MKVFVFIESAEDDGARRPNVRAKPTVEADAG